MASNPKHPSRPGRPTPLTVKKAAVELPFDDGDLEPLRADDPVPQRVPQLPSPAPRRPLRKAEEAIPTSVYQTQPQRDEEFAPSYDDGELSDPGFKPAFLYVERGPGAGQLVPVKQGVLVLGRASVADLRMQHPSISRRHAQLVRNGDFFYVKDLGSQNGTFVNGTKIITEVEVQPGDELAVGNALLKLRGPVVAADSTAVGAVKPRKSAPRTSGAIKVAAFAGAVGFGLAAVMMFAVLRTRAQPTSRPLPVRSSLSRTVESAAPAVVAAAVEPEVEISADPISVKIQEAMQKEAAAPPVAEEREPVVAPKQQRAAPVSAVAAAKAPARKTQAHVARKAAAPAAAVDEAFAEEDEETASAPTKSAAGGENAPLILARYEAGNAGAALELAKKSGNDELAGKLQTFKDSYDAAKKAVAGNNGSAAIRSYEKALKIDEQLSSGWGQYGVEIRKQLSSLYTLVGQHYVSSGNGKEAAKAFQVALKHDPQNARAREALESAAAVTATEPRAKIADAFGDDEEAAPVRKPVKRAAPAENPRAAIDDAFGD